MRAAYLTARPTVGDLASKIHLDDKLIPNLQAQDLKTHDILVRVHAFSLNVDDLHVAEGSFLGGVPGMQSRPASSEKPLVIGSDFAGVVEAVGSGVDAEKFRPGRRVCGMNKQQSVFSEAGTWAERTITKAGNLVPIPDDVTFAEAAASVMPLFVVRGLLDCLKHKPSGNEKILVIGASGGIGSVLIPVLRGRGSFDITGVCSGRNAKFVQALGADRVVDYTVGPVEEALKQEGRPYDIVFDLIGGPASYRTGKAILGKGGRFVTPTGPVEWVGDERLSYLGQVALIAKMIWHSVVLNWVPGPHPYYHIAAPLDLSEDMFQQAFEGGLRPQIQKKIAFDDRIGFEKAIELVRSHRAKGKIVVEMN